MNIIIENGTYGLSNLGDVAMLKSMVQRLRRVWPKAFIQVIADDKACLARHLPMVGQLPTEDRSAWLRTFNLVGGWRRLVPALSQGWLMDREREFRCRHPEAALKRMGFRLGCEDGRFLAATRFVEQIREADWVFASGGGYINDAFGDHARDVLDVMQLAQRLGRKTAMMGQGLGPIRNRSLQRAASSTLPALKALSLRESIHSWWVAKESCRVPEHTVSVTGDDAIELAYARRGDALGCRIGVNMRLARYSGMTEARAREIGQVLVDFAAEVGGEFESVPISIPPAHSDQDAIREMLGWAVPEPPVEETSMTVESVIEAAGRCRVVMTASYHAAVFALSQGVPAVVVVASDYYASKYAGLSGQFPGGVFIVNLQDADWRGYLAFHLRDAWNRAESCRHGLLTAAWEQVQLGHSAYDKLVACQ